MSDINHIIVKYQFQTHIYYIPDNKICMYMINSSII